MAGVCMFGAFATVYNYCWTLNLEKEQIRFLDGELSYEAYANLSRKSIFFWLIKVVIGYYDDERRLTTGE